MNILFHFKIEHALLERKKQELLAKYVSDELLKCPNSIKTVLFLAHNNLSGVLHQAPLLHHENAPEFVHFELSFVG